VQAARAAVRTASPTRAAAIPGAPVPGMSTGPRVVLFARYPEPGRAKTRLIPALGAAGAATLHRRLTERALAVARAAGLPVELRYTGAGEDAFRAWLGPELALVAQGEGDLGARMAAATVETPVILVGTDLPDLGPHHLRAAADAIGGAPAAIGPAEDGGYWLIALRTPMPDLFAPLDWGTDRVFAATMGRFAALGVLPAVLDRLADLDRPEDLARWPELTA